MKRFIVKSIFLPLSILYGLIIDFRNWLFDNQLLPSVRPSVYSISVGNLTVGGTGKTPMVEFLIKRYPSSVYMNKGSVATLSRGYGRKTRGFRVATANDTAATIGDEPLQIHRKFGAQVRVCVGERRVEAIRSLLTLHPETDLVILDDAFQHRAVHPHLSIMLTDYSRPFYDDYPFPAGRLRERRKGARRADAIVVTKCPANLWEAEQQRIIARIRPYTRSETPIFFAGLQYGQPVSFATHQPVADLKNVVLVSGLANADPLEKYVRQTFEMQKHVRFADHYAYTRTDLESVLTNLPDRSVILTTEKDWVKLDALLTAEERSVWPLYYLPVATQFLSGQESAFLAFLDNHRQLTRA
ncbi:MULTISPECIES: tetraacyldisaccharide 4'-kinase [unclassified Spirosoma]|uniref:tetraacyldisaccharide 4'-kinase n=1 Tax=unclassified Spirosoma TaxID=2621999 RepID=UPI0009650EC4|nr:MULTISPECIES: tetraacyldisaccharide 4'-kinase [unclassified Spirosoma]MBN8825612.1 tetraacyldisaccharide 4'-kinase [Spirosoma sp.]OJW71684.1 MAG: tetraacyldisaccharide 4'-kinase [Spirosoma sp. 48-14]